MEQSHTRNIHLKNSHLSQKKKKEPSKQSSVPTEEEAQQKLQVAVYVQPNWPGPLFQHGDGQIPLNNPSFCF